MRGRQAQTRQNAPPGRRGAAARRLRADRQPGHRAVLNARPHPPVQTRPAEPRNERHFRAVRPYKVSVDHGVAGCSEGHPWAALLPEGAPRYTRRGGLPDAAAEAQAEADRPGVDHQPVPAETQARPGPARRPELQVGLHRERQHLRAGGLGVRRGRRRLWRAGRGGSGDGLDEEPEAEEPEPVQNGNGAGLRVASTET